MKDRLIHEGIREKTYLIVGGGTMNPDWAKEIKADANGRHGENAVELCELLIGEKPKAQLNQPLVKED